jgi:hypothetical protein
MRIRSALVTVLALTGLIAGFTRAAEAQPLAETVPADAVVYAGWAGNKGLGARVKGTHLESVLKATNMPQRVKDAIDLVVKGMGEKDPDSTEVLAALSALGEAAWKHPSVLYVTLDAKGIKKAPGLVIKWKADEEAPALLATLKKIVDDPAQGAPLPTGPKVTQAGAYVVLYAGSMTEQEAVKEKPAAALTGQAQFAKAFAQVAGKSSEIAFYFDGATLMKVTSDEIQEAAGAAAKANWVRSRDGLGLEGIKCVLLSGGFDGVDWVSRGFVESPGMRKGLPGLLEGKPLSNETLKLAPKRAIWVSAFHLDLADVLGKVQTMVTELDPSTGAQLDANVQMLKQNLGVDMKALFGAAGPEWLLYSDPAMIGPGGSGAVVVNRLRDSAVFKEQLAAVEEVAAKVAAAKGNSFKVEKIKQGGLEISRVNAVVIMPSWAVKGDVFYLGMNPHAVETAAKQAGAADSLLDKPEFKQVMARVGEKPATSVGFVDLTKTAIESHQVMLMLAQMAGPVLAQGQMPNPLPGLLPPLATLTPDLGPAGGISWMDTQGYHWTTVAPFPGARLLGPDGTYTAVGPGALAVGAALPALGAARLTAQQMKSNAHLRGIHQSMVIYASQKGAYPTSMGVLFDEQFVGKDLLVSPKNPVTFPADFAKMSTAEKGKWLDENGAYVILRWGQKETTDAEVVMGYLKPSHFPGRGISVVFGDNHALWMPIEEARELIAKQYPNHKLQGFPEGDAAPGVREGQ